MRTIIGFIAVLSIAAASHGQSTPETKAAEETVARLAGSANQQLAKSIAELNALRESIAAEKLPLAQELTKLEERLSELRKEHDRVTRLLDSGGLDIATIKANMKAPTDELSYVGNLLDEYARSFDSKINISEMQQYGEAIEAAKQVTENKELSVAEKLAKQIEFIDLSTKRLFDVIGGTRFPGVGVDLQGTVADGQFALIGPVALFSANGGANGGAGGASGLVVPQSGSTNPLIRPLEGEMQVGLTSLVASGEGLMPLDPSRGGALKALVQKFNLIHIFEKGGPIMWPLLIASILALAVVIERLFFLLIEKFRRNPKAMDKFFIAVTQGDIKEAIKIGKRSKFYVVRALGYALSHREGSLANALVYAQAQELKRYQRGIAVLDTVITLAPLLGLLGTVTGMMGSFSIIGGELSSPGAITGGIAEALIATAFGLGIAITALLPFNFLNTKTELARHEIESASTQLELLVSPRTSVAAAQAAYTANAPTVIVMGEDGRQAVHAPAPSPAPAPAWPNAALSEHDTNHKRDELKRQLAELKLELGEREREIQQLAARGRSLQSAGSNRDTSED